VARPDILDTLCMIMIINDDAQQQAPPTESAGNKTHSALHSALLLLLLLHLHWTCTALQLCCTSPVRGPRRARAGARTFSENHFHGLPQTVEVVCRERPSEAKVKHLWVDTRQPVPAD
jgi:hypothetical protein